MEITLTPEAEAVVRQKVSDGRFASAAEVVEAAVRLLDTRDRYEYLRGLILAAEQEVQDGKVVEWTPELHRQWRHEAEERAHEDLPLDPDVCP
jgi:antitoxin ParD1/3/4